MMDKDTVVDPNVAALGLTEEMREMYEERAAILQYDAGMSREDAERLAYRLVTAHTGIRVFHRS